MANYLPHLDDIPEQRLARNGAPESISPFGLNQSHAVAATQHQAHQIPVRIAPLEYRSNTDPWQGICKETDDDNLTRDC